VFLRDVFYTFSADIVSVGFNFLIGILLARALTVSDRGVMVLVMTLPWTVVSLISLGLPQANIYLVGRKERDARLVLGNALVNALIIGLLAVAVLSALKSEILGTVLKGLPDNFWTPLMLLIPILLIETMMLSILRARQRFDLFNLRRFATPIVTLVGFSAVLLVARRGLDVVAGAYVVIACLTAVLTMALTRREVPIRPTWDRQLTEESLQFGSKSYVQSLIGNLNYRLDVYLLAFFLAPEQVAFYGVAMSLAEVAWYIPNSVGVVLFPRLSHASLESVHQITAQVCRTTLMMTGTIVGGLFAVSWFLVPLFYGPAYRATVPPLLILLPGVLFMGLYKVLTRNFTSRNRQQVSILAAGAALAINFGLDWILIPSRGGVGAAIASTVGYTVAGVVLLGFFLRDSGLPWQDVLLPRWSELVGHWHWAKQYFPSFRSLV